VPDWPPSSSPCPSGTAQRYVLRGGGAPAPADEVEHRTRLAIEVVVSWRGDVLTVRHLSPPGVFFVGGSGSSSDVSLPDELLGSGRLCIAVGSRSEVSAVLPAQARAWLTLPDGSTQSLEPGSPAALTGARSGSSERLLPLGLGYRAHLCFGDIELQVAAVAAGRAPPGQRSIGFEPAALAYFALSSLSVAGIFTLLSLMAPPLGLNQDERIESERLYLLQSYLTASAERLERQPAQAPEKSGPMVAAAAARWAAPASALRSALPLDEAEAEHSAPEPRDALEEGEQAAPQTARERGRALEDARSFGIIDVLRRSVEALADPRIPFRRELDGEGLATMQQLFNPDSSLGDEGPGGLALSGTGLRGGDKGNIIALDGVRTAGGGEGGEIERFASVGRFTGSHRPQQPQLRHGERVVTDRLPSSVVRRTVNAHLVQLRQCYEQGLADNPTLTGGTIVRFAVQSTGLVDQVDTLGATLPSQVRGCIERVFRGLSFPRPESGPAHVEYPIDFTP
jgi:hypothetical protein